MLRRVPFCPAVPYLGRMSITETAVKRPQFTIGDRLRKARTLLGPEMDQRRFATLIEVDRNTVTNYELERTSPARMKRLVLREWARATGVDYDWLVGDEAVGVTGGVPAPRRGPAKARHRGAGWRPEQDSNLQPTD